MCNNWNSFYNDIEKIKSNLIKNAYPPFLIDKFIKKSLDYKFSSNQTTQNYYHTISKSPFLSKPLKFGILISTAARAE